MRIFLSILHLCFVPFLGTAQQDSIFSQGVYRNFILHLPSGYTPANEYPIVVNMHGLGSTAFEQQLYSQFDAISDEHDFIVVYPDAINNSWDLFGNTDVTFLDNLLDTLRERYSTNDCLFFMGMSQGGFMSYKLACEYDAGINAIASVTGNMTTFLQASCQGGDGIPVMQFHGTADATVPYNGTFGIPPIEETIDYWVGKNQTDDTPVIVEFPDIDPDDNSTATSFTYEDGLNESKVVFYKIENGGHSWPGAFPVASLGNTNQDIDASEIIGEFFSSYCSGPSAVDDNGGVEQLVLSPNPTSGFIHIYFPNQLFDVLILDATGREVAQADQVNGDTILQLEKVTSGLYFVQIILEEGSLVTRKILVVK